MGSTPANLFERAGFCWEGARESGTRRFDAFETKGVSAVEYFGLTGLRVIAFETNGTALDLFVLHC